jgi:hypothetical protein
MTLTKLLAVVGVAGVISCVVGLVSQQRTIAALRESAVSTRQQLEKLAVENARIAKSNIEISSELARLSRAASVPLNVRSEPATPSPTPGSSIPRAFETASHKAVTGVDADKKRRQVATWHRRYDEFFQQRGLDTAQSDRLIELFALQAEARADLQGAVEKSGSSGDAPGVETLRSQLYEPILREMREILGDEGYAEYNKFEMTSFFRLAFVDPLLGRFRSAEAPLSPEQRERLVNLVAANNHPRKVKPTDIGSQAEIDWDAVAEQAAGTLTSAQIAVLRAEAAKQKASP